MAHGTERKCPLLIEPDHRTMPRSMWRQLDREIRLLWQKHHYELGQAATQQLIYGGIPEYDGCFRGRSLLGVAESLSKPVRLKFL